MPLGLIILSVLAGLVLFGAAQRVLDRMHLTDTQALVILGVIFLGSFIDIPIARGRADVTVNVGGALIPTALAIYVLSRAGTAAERLRTVAASLVTAGVIWGVARWTDFGPHGGTPMFLDSLWLFSIVGGIVAYILGRSRRAAFVAGVLGLVLFQIADVLLTFSAGGTTALPLGGAGFFDAVILSGLISTALAEIVGETRERLQGGPDPDRPEPLKQALSNEAGAGSRDTDEQESEARRDDEDGSTPKFQMVKRRDDEGGPMHGGGGGEHE